MTALNVLADGALRAAQLLALLFVPPAFAAQPVPSMRSVEAHRLLTASDARLLGALADVRALQVPSGGAGNGCAEVAGHASLTLDEAIADRFTLAPTARPAIETIAAPPPVAEVSRALLVEQDDGRFLVVVPDRRAARASLVLRPSPGAAGRFELGRVEAGRPRVLPLPPRVAFDALAAGAVEMTLVDGDETVWTTLVVERTDSEMQARVAD